VWPRSRAGPNHVLNLTAAARAASQGIDPPLSPRKRQPASGMLAAYMGHFRLALSVTFFVCAFTLLAYWNSGGWWAACVLGALVGLLFGLIFGGVRGQWLEVFYPRDRSERMQYVLIERHDGLVEVSLTSRVREGERTLEASAAIPFGLLGKPLTREELDEIVGESRG